MVLLASGSFLGLGVAPAIAEPDERTYTIDVELTDSTCVTPIVPATWNPDPSVAFVVGNSVDINSANFPLPLVDFTVGLGFADGTDSCNGEMPVAASGNVVTAFTNLPSPLLKDSLECEEANPCSASGFFTGSNDIYATLSIDEATATAGTYTATLSVTWTP